MASKYTPETREAICRLIKFGASAKIAAEASGVTEQTFYNWVRRHRAFREQIEHAHAEAEAILIGRVQQAAAKGSWRAACWLLERAWPERWAPLADRVAQDRELDHELDQLLAE